MPGRLEGRVAVITGAGRGAGRTLALGLAREGAAIVVAEINAESAEETAELVRTGGGRAVAVPTDVTSPESTRAMAEAAQDAYGRIDVLVNNAGIAPTQAWDEISLEDWNRVLAANLTGQFLCARAVFPAMRARGYGKIINVASRAAFRGGVGTLHYVASKAGVLGLTRALAREVGSHGIRVNAIAPGFMRTPMVQAMIDAGVPLEEELARMVGQQCIKRQQEPDDLVGTVVYLASADSDFVSGQTIVVDGGLHML